ncbi:trypsin-1-like [Uranotaenia lowii]|uniref:trypsin-1-like n=1 Tax=Uranotaenia lowii TaxID=190385 RepID=UPI0024795B29|nr:trypsin-1-like [Uranotaenia lowii]
MSRLEFLIFCQCHSNRAKPSSLKCSPTAELQAHYFERDQMAPLCLLYFSSIADHIRAGSIYSDKGGTVLKVEKVISHPKHVYLKTDYAVALVFLEGHLEGSVSKQIGLASSQDSYAPGVVGEVTGFKRPDASSWSFGALQETNVTILSSEECAGTFSPPITEYTERMLCANSPVGPDEGYCAFFGNLVVNNELVAIHNNGEPCQAPDSPSIYIKMLDVIDWIKSYLN